MLIVVLTASLLATLSSVALGWLPVHVAVLTGLGVVLSVASVGLLPGRPSLWFLATFTGVITWAALLAPEAATVSLSGLSGGLARVQLEVGRGGCSDRGCWCEAELRRCDELQPGACIEASVRVGVSSPSELPLGAVVTALGRLKPRAAFFNPTATTSWPDTRPHVHVTLEPGSQPRIDSVGPLDAWVARTRASIRRGLDTSLQAPHAGIARALILGEGSAVDRELNDAIRNAGVSHVLAVSGMHVTLLVGALVLLVRACWLRTPLALRWEARRVAAGLGVVLAPLIARLCGASPSAVRAAWTSTLMYLVVALGLKPSALAVTALVVAAHATLVPLDALHPGFVLSVLATAALLSHRIDSDVGAVSRALRESLRAWLATAPFLLLCFGQTSLVALVANVALLPVGTALVPLAALHVLNAQLSLASVLPSASVFELASAAFVEAARYCASLDPGLTVPPLTAVQLLALITLTGALMVPMSLRARGWVALLTGLVAAVSEWSLRHPLRDGALRVTFVDVGQGDATLIELASGERMLIDAGGAIGGGPDPGAVAVVPLLRARRIDALDVVVLSHPHPDHYGGLAAVLSAVKVHELWDTGQAEAELDGGAVADLLSRARALGTRVVRPDTLCGPPRRLGAAALDVHAPCPMFDLTRGPNDNSFVVRLTHGQRSFLFTGDAEREAEAELSRSPRSLRSDVLKVAHHGSRTSSTASMLEAVSPWLAVVSAGRSNRFGHPHDEVVQRITPRAHLLQTDVVGGVQVHSDGTHLTVQSALGATELHL